MKPRKAMKIRNVFALRDLYNEHLKEAVMYIADHLERSKNLPEVTFQCLPNKNKRQQCEEIALSIIENKKRMIPFPAFMMVDFKTHDRHYDDWWAKTRKGWEKSFENLAVELAPLGINVTPLWEDVGGFPGCNLIFERD